MTPDPTRDDISFLRRVSEEGRYAPLLGGRYLFMWGTVITIAYTFQYLILSQTLAWPGWSIAAMWLIVMAIAGRKMQHIHRTHLAKIRRKHRLVTLGAPAIMHVTVLQLACRQGRHFTVGRHHRARLIQPLATSALRNRQTVTSERLRASARARALMGCLARKSTISTLDCAEVMSVSPSSSKRAATRRSITALIRWISNQMPD